MKEYLENAMCKFLEDNGIEHGELKEVVSSDFRFDYIGANISMKLIDEFESEFEVSQSCHDGVEEDKWLNVEFDFVN